MTVLDLKASITLARIASRIAGIPLSVYIYKKSGPLQEDCVRLMDVNEEKAKEIAEEALLAGYTWTCPGYKALYMYKPMSGSFPDEVQKYELGDESDENYVERVLNATESIVSDYLHYKDGNWRETDSIRIKRDGDKIIVYMLGKQTLELTFDQDGRIHPSWSNSSRGGTHYACPYEYQSHVLRDGMREIKKVMLEKGFNF